MQLVEKLGLYFTPSIKLYPVTTATLAQADTLHEQGYWIKAASHYATVFSKTRDPKILVQAYSQLTQEMINCGAYYQASRALEEGYQRIHVITDERIRTVGLAVYYEKKGWIDDNLCNPSAAIKSFNKAKAQLTGIRSRIAKDTPIDEIDKIAQRINSTAEHFLGRNQTEAAKTSVNPIQNLQKSIKHFRSDLASHYMDADSGDYQPANIGFQYSHLALSHFRLANAYNAQRNTENAQGELQAAKDNIALAEGFFEDFAEKNPRSTIEGHIEMVLGMSALELESPNRARAHFLKALDIRKSALKTGVEPYTKGYADASLGVALTYRQEYNIIQTIRYVLSALCINPGYTSSRVIAGTP